MLYDVAEAKYKEYYKLEITFENGKKGIVDFSNYSKKGGVFKKFSNIEFFKQFTVSRDLGTLVWADEIDIAPETLYENCQENM